MATIQLRLDKSTAYSNATEADIIELRNIAESGGTASVMAAVLLEQLTGERIYPAQVLPEEGRSAEVKTRVGRELPKLAAIYPNPASGSFYVSYILPPELKSAGIEIFNVEGKCVKSIDVSSGIGLEYIDGRELSSGIYIMTFTIDGKRVAEEKLTFTK